MEFRNFNEEEIKVIKRYLEEELEQIDNSLDRIKDEILERIIDGSLDKEDYLKDDYKFMLIHKRIVKSRLDDIRYITEIEKGSPYIRGNREWLEYLAN